MVVSGGLLLAGCATKIDSGKAERFISRTVESQVGARVSSVACPTGKTAKKGDTFTCVVHGADGTTGRTFVTETDDKGNVHVHAPFVHTREMERSIASGIAKKVKEAVKVSCPEIIIASKGGKFACRARDSQGETAKIEAVQTDASGHVRFHVVS